MLPFLTEADVHHVIDLLAGHFPGSTLALDTAGSGIVGTQDQHDALSKVEARMQWACADPAGLAEWAPGTQVLASHTLSNLPAPMYVELPATTQKMLSGLAAQQLPQVEEYWLSLVRLP